MKHHYNEEEDVQTAVNELHKTAKILLPLHERQLGRLKKTLRDEELNLRTMKRNLRTGERRLVKCRSVYQECLDDFANHHTGVILLHEKLHQTLEAEKRARTKLLDQEAENQTMTAEITRQVELVDHTKKSIKACQKQIDKFEYILEQEDLT